MIGNIGRVSNLFLTKTIYAIALALFDHGRRDLGAAQRAMTAAVPVPADPPVA